MSFDPAAYIHDSDQKALKALKAIPGFALFARGFMNVWNERSFKVINMSTRIRLGEDQMRKYYDMLPPICEKLGIAVPELYIQMNVVPNAATYGDTNPFIVMTSGLLETMPDELIPTVLAHECGHIACRHSLYTTMGSIVLSGVDIFSAVKGLSGLITVPLQVAFFYWMRCSEYSADRAAVLCDGTADKMQEVCMRFAGWSKQIDADASVQEFIRQAADYRELINSSKWNKTLEFMMLRNVTHPLTAVRATECGEWAESDRFRSILNGLPVPAPERLADPSDENVKKNKWLTFLNSRKQDRAEDVDKFRILQEYQKMLTEGRITQEEFDELTLELLDQ